MDEQNLKPIPDSPMFPSQGAEMLGLAPLSIPTEDVEMFGLAPVQLFESPAEMPVKEPAPADSNRKKPQVSL